MIVLQKIYQVFLKDFWLIDIGCIDVIVNHVDFTIVLVPRQDWHSNAGVRNGVLIVG